MEGIVQILKALSDETRLKILLILSRRSICAKGIARHLDISEAAVSQHIKVLKEAGIIVGEKIGYYVKYDLQKSTLIEISDFINDICNEHTTSSCNIDLHIPNECASLCRHNKNKYFCKNFR